MNRSEGASTYKLNCPDNGAYGLWRHECGPTLYPSLKTAVTADVLEAGLLFAAGILFISFLLIVPGYRGKARWFFLIRTIIGLFTLTSILLCNYGQEWEVAELTTKTPYRVGLREEIHAHIGVKIGLRSVNITLKATPDKEVSFNGGSSIETINYNERFNWDNLGWDLGRIGFGPFAGRFNQEFRAGQWKGLPYPILWIAEYFTIDGEGIRWGRHYLQAGFFAHMMIWLAFPMWIMAMALHYMVLSYGGVASMMTGLTLGGANLIFYLVRNPLNLTIPFEDGNLVFHWGWCFWLNLATAVLCVLLSIIVLVMDTFRVEALISFLGGDILQEYEDVYEETSIVGASVDPLGRSVSDVLHQVSLGMFDTQASSASRNTVVHYKRRRGTHGSLGRSALPHSRPFLSLWSRQELQLHGSRLSQDHGRYSRHIRTPPVDGWSGCYDNVPMGAAAALARPSMSGEALPDVIWEEAEGSTPMNTIHREKNGACAT